MSRAESSSSCSHNSWLMRNQSLSCNSGGCRKSKKSARIHQLKYNQIFFFHCQSYIFHCQSYIFHCQSSIFHRWSFFFPASPSPTNERKSSSFFSDHWTQINHWTLIPKFCFCPSFPFCKIFDFTSLIFPQIDNNVFLKFFTSQFFYFEFFFTTKITCPTIVSVTYALHSVTSTKVKRCYIVFNGRYQNKLV